MYFSKYKQTKKQIGSILQLCQSYKFLLIATMESVAPLSRAMSYEINLVKVWIIKEQQNEIK